MRLKSAWGLLSAIFLLGTMLSCVQSSTVGSSGVGFIWLATEGDQQVRAYQVNLSDGSVGQVGSNVATGVTPVAMALSRDAKALFIANSSDNTITSYTVNSDGSLSAGSTTQTTVTCPQTPPPCVGSPPPPVCGQSPVALATDPSGKFLFVAAQGTFDLCSGSSSSVGLVSTYTVDGTSLALSSTFETQSVSDTTGTGPSGVAVAPTGNFLYVSNQFTNNVESFSYDTSSGALLPLNTYPTGTNPSALAFSRCAGVTQGTTSCPAADGNNLFVANEGSNNISMFAACIQPSATCGGQAQIPDGSLVPSSTPTIAAGISPTSLVVDPVLNFVYAVNSKSNNISQFRYNSATGSLSALTPPNVAAGTNPAGGGITSDGTYFVVSNNNSSSISVYTVTAGKLAPASTPTVTLAGQPSAILVR